MLAAALAAAAFAVHSQELVVGLSSPVTSLDPHFHNLTPNNSLATHVFEQLVTTDAQQKLGPGLAVSWQALDATTWEFRLRKGVKWHDGSDFTAEDVVATLKRVPGVPNSPASFAIYTRPIAQATAVDPNTLHFRTSQPHPLLPNDLVAVRIVPRKVAESAKTEDFNSGKAMIGTGPYKYAEYVAGDRVVLVANDRYWGQKPAFQKVRFKMITSSPARSWSSPTTCTSKARARPPAVSMQTATASRRAACGTARGTRCSRTFHLNRSYARALPRTVRTSATRSWTATG